MIWESFEKGDSEPDEGEEPPENAAKGTEAGTSRNWRQVYETELRKLSVDQRVALARTADEGTLCALCFDPSPKVVLAVLRHEDAGLRQARLVAEHHRSGAGLDALGRNAAFLRDTQTFRLLLRNPQLSDRLLLRILRPKRMEEIYRLCGTRDASERARRQIRKQLREAFPTGSAEERVQLILRTEGRCLRLLVGLPLGSRATALLCRRPMVSTLLIRNLAAWPSTPPAVLTHLARQPIVRRNPSLRNAILRHPNAPSQLKTELTP